jgi:hypothetical protein
MKIEFMSLEVSSADDIPIEIDLREHTSAMKLIKHIINPRQWVLVLDGNLIQGMIIHAHLLSTVLLRDENHRGSPWG